MDRPDSHADMTAVYLAEDGMLAVLVISNHAATREFTMHRPTLIELRDQISRILDE